MEELEKQIQEKVLELKYLQDLKLKKEAFESLDIKELKNNLLQDVRYVEFSQIVMGFPGITTMFSFKLNGKEICLEIKEDRDLASAKALSSVKKAIAEKLLNEIIKLLNE